MQSYTGRILALARTHEALASARWDGVELSHVVRLTLSPYCSESSDRVRIRGANVMLPARASTPICMVLHELATNAAKYGALSVPAGRVEMTWSVDDDDALRIEWSEHGGPPITTSAFGILTDGSFNMSTISPDVHCSSKLELYVSTQ